MAVITSQPVKKLRGIARVPGDKSISHRALMLGALAEGETVVTGLLEGEDVLRTAKALLTMGVAIIPPDNKGGIWRIRGIGPKFLRSPKNAIDLGNSGTSARLLMGLTAGYSFDATFTGDASLRRRPMERVTKPLAQMGARFESSSAGTLPIRIIGSPALKPIRYRLPVASAQLKSAILLAGLHADGDTAIIEPQPTRDHTERMLAFMGVSVASERQADGSSLVTLKGRQKLSARPIAVPSDPSSAAFLTVAALITTDSAIVIPHVLINTRRTGIYDTLIEMGADISFENIHDSGGEPVADIHVKSSRLKGVTVPPARVPSMIDEFPILSVAAAFATGETVMTDLAELRVKESDRLAVMAAGLAAAGVKLSMGEDSLTVHGAGGIPPSGGCRIETHLDHRIAMSFLVLGMASAFPVTIDDDGPVATSFPGFAALLNSLGANIN